MKNVLGLNVHEVSSCQEHAKDLTTMIFPGYAAMLLVVLSSLASFQLNFFVLRSRKDGWVFLFFGCLGFFPLF